MQGLLAKLSLVHPATNDKKYTNQTNVKFLFTFIYSCYLILLVMILLVWMHSKTWTLFEEFKEILLVNESQKHFPLFFKDLLNWTYLFVKPIACYHTFVRIFFGAILWDFNKCVETIAVLDHILFINPNHIDTPCFFSRSWHLNKERV